MGKHILLVEDTPALAESIADILRMEDYKVTIVDDGGKALIFLASNTCSLIISDIVMPNVDGMTLLKAIREHEHYRDIPFIFLSAKVTPETIEEGTTAGANLLIKKPCDTDYLLNSISVLIK